MSERSEGIPKEVNDDPAKNSSRNGQPLIATSQSFTVL